MASSSSSSLVIERPSFIFVRAATIVSVLWRIKAINERNGIRKEIFFVFFLYVGHTAGDNSDSKEGSGSGPARVHLRPPPFCVCVCVPVASDKTGKRMGPPRGLFLSFPPLIFIPFVTGANERTSERNL